MDRYSFGDIETLDCYEDLKRYVAIAREQRMDIAFDSAPLKELVPLAPEGLAALLLRDRVVEYASEVSQHLVQLLLSRYQDADRHQYCRNASVPISIGNFDPLVEFLKEVRGMLGNSSHGNRLEKSIQKALDLQDKISRKPQKVFL